MQACLFLSAGRQASRLAAGRRSLSSGEEAPSSFATNCLRGMGQMAFCAHAGSGALITSALAVASPLLASAAVLGCVSSTAAAAVLSRCGVAGLRPEIELGLYGFNGGLLGAGAYALFPVFSTALTTPQLAAVAAAGGAATTLLAVALRPLFKSVPFLSIPFNAVMIGALLASRAPAVHSALAAATPSPSPAPLPLVDRAAASFDVVLAAPLHDALAGCAGMALADRPLTGLTMLAAVALSYSRPRPALEAAAVTLWGAALGAALAAQLGAPAALVAAGLHGFNSALTALGVYTFVGPHTGSSSPALVAYLSAAAAAAAALNFYATPYAIASLGVGVGALPFCFTTCLAIWLAPRLFRSSLKLRFS